MSVPPRRIDCVYFLSVSSQGELCENEGYKNSVWRRNTISQYANISKG